MKRWLSLLGVLAACRRPSPGSASDAAADAAAGAHAQRDASAPDTATSFAGPISPFPDRKSYGELCPEVSVADAGAGPPAPRPAGSSSLVVGFRSATTAAPGRGGGRDFTGYVVVKGAAKPDHAVFRAGAEDPHQCCATAADERLTFSCMFSGIDSIEGRGVARRDGQDLRITWCTADLSTGEKMEASEIVVPIPSGGGVRFVAPIPKCSPALP